MRYAAIIGIALSLAFIQTASVAQEVVRVATYNIKFLDTDFSGEEDGRLEKLKTVIEQLEADVIGLQEIEDRDALEMLFPKRDWHIVIDDDSGGTQDLAVVARKDFELTNFSGNSLDADNEHFLFPSRRDNSPFPNRRDVLRVDLKTPDTGYEFTILVNHTKARKGGRNTTQPRREHAARKIVKFLEPIIDDTNIIYVCDCNDTPDDSSANILETGNPNAPPALEEVPGPFMINLTEPLYADGHITYGLNSSDVYAGRVDTKDTRSRMKNFNYLGSDRNSGNALLDQIYISPNMLDVYVEDSAKVFDHPSAVIGNFKNRASDHVPVYADFNIGGDQEDEDDTYVSTILINGVMANPTGTDRGNEYVTVSNSDSSNQNVNGWVIQDRSGNEFELSGSIQGNQTRRFNLPSGVLPLNNTGDDLSLYDTQGELVDAVTYNSSDAIEGQIIEFE